MSSLTHRLATPIDVPTILPLMKAFNAIEEIEWDPSQGAPALHQLVSDRDLGCLGLLFRNEETIGYFVLTWGFDLEWYGRDAFLTELFLVEAVRDQKLGPEAMAIVEHTARSHAAKAINLLVRHENARAIALYRKAGFNAPDRHFLTKDLR